MKKLQILSSSGGCPMCAQLTKNAAAAATALGIPFKLEKVTALKEVMKFGVMATPALVVDGTLKSEGRVPSVEELKRLLA